MYCTNCGLKLGGHFCASCGTRASSPDKVVDVLPLGEWRQEVRYAVLLRFPEVRARLDNVPECAPTVSGEKWIELYDEVLQPLTGVSVKTVASIAGPLYARMGIKTGKTQAKVLDAPTGQVIVDVLCTLASNGLPLLKVHQGEAGCVIEAKLPSDLWASEGRVVVTIERVGAGTKVEAATKIPGQLFDWGKSARYLQKLFADLPAQAA